MPRQWRRGMIVVCGLLALSRFAARPFEDWRFESRLAEARREAMHGRHAEAGPRLAALAAERPDHGEAALLLGDLEDLLGHAGLAVAAWSRVPPTSPHRGEASLRLGRRAVDLGRLADAEEALLSALRSPGPHVAESRDLLTRLYWREARFAEAASLIEAQWRDLDASGRLTIERAVDQLRGHLSLDLETFPVDEIEADLRRLLDRSPEDDRIRLALARWATRAGRFDESSALIDQCLRRRPRDPVAWLARLDLARASDRPDSALVAFPHIPANRLEDAEVASLNAWIAAARGDLAAERAGLDALLKINPGDLAAIEKLAELLLRLGDRDGAAKLRARKAGLVDARDRYKAHFKDDELGAKPIEMAGLATELGRRFEARAFLALASRRIPGDPAVKEAIARSGPTSPTGGSHKGTLADVLRTGPRSIPVIPRREVGATPAIPRFEDDAKASGLVFRFDNGATSDRQLPEAMSGGVGLLDFDGDGWLDVYLIQGGPFPPPTARPTMGDRLFRNRRDGTFEDATGRAGLDRFPGGYSQGVAVGDFDNDDRPDLFLTRWRGYTLYHNKGDGTFEDATGRAGLGGDRDWPTSAAFADLDNDGDLDLYVCHYLKWDADHPRLCPNPESGVNRSCDPRHFDPLPDHLFRNDGGRFVDVTAEAGVVDRDGRGLGVVAADVDEDGLVDLFVANDTTANYLFLNRGGFRFEEAGLASGVACNANGAYQAGMGTAVGDLDGDGRLDLLVTNFYGESTTFYRNLGGGMFGDESDEIGLAAPSRFLLGFGIALLDANNDGHLDLATANGHVNDDRPKFPYAMPAQLLLGTGAGRLVDASRAAGPPWEVLRVARGLAAGDLDNDGRVDLILVAQDGPLAFFRNKSEAGRSITLKLEGTASPRDGVGALVTVLAGGKRRVAPRYGGGSYQSAADPRLHFGLGAAGRAEEVEIRWPSGRVDRHEDLPDGRGFLFREGDPTAHPLPGFDGHD